jgi:hypothetical protein
MAANRAEVVAGLRALVELLDGNPKLAVPYEGTESKLAVFVDGPQPVAQALLYAQAMHARSAFVVGPSGAPGTVWVTAEGRIHGLRIKLYLRASEVCVRTADGWQIPAELRPAATPPGGDQR